MCASIASVKSVAHIRFRCGEFQIQSTKIVIENNNWMEFMHLKFAQFKTTSRRVTTLNANSMDIIMLCICNAFVCLWFACYNSEMQFKFVKWWSRMVNLKFDYSNIFAMTTKRILLFWYAVRMKARWKNLDTTADEHFILAINNLAIKNYISVTFSRFYCCKFAQFRILKCQTLDVYVV